MCQDTYLSTYVDICMDMDTHVDILDMDMDTYRYR